MTCINCHGQQVVWIKDEFGSSTCLPCPVCNLHGNVVRKETEKFEKKIDEMKVRERFSEERKRRNQFSKK